MTDGLHAKRHGFLLGTLVSFLCNVGGGVGEDIRNTKIMKRLSVLISWLLKSSDAGFQLNNTLSVICNVM